MVEQDTVKLLRECDAGVKMGIASIGDVEGYAKDNRLQQTLTTCRKEHEKLEGEIRMMLSRYHDDGKEPNPVAKGMAHMKTNVKLSLHMADATIADLMTDGCNMGVKSLNQYLNQYEAADERSKDIAKRLIHLEQTLAENLRGYL